MIVYVYTGAGKFTDKSVDAADGEVVLLGVRSPPVALPYVPDADTLIGADTF